MNLFERKTEICYCVPNGASACALCRERLAAKSEPLLHPVALPYEQMEFQEGDQCPECAGKEPLEYSRTCRLEILHRMEGCSCHINPPCSYCTEQRLHCKHCGLLIDCDDA